MDADRKLCDMEGAAEFLAGQTDAACSGVVPAVKKMSVESRTSRSSSRLDMLSSMHVKSLMSSKFCIVCVRPRHHIQSASNPMML